VANISNNTFGKKTVNQQLSLLTKELSAKQTHEFPQATVVPKRKKKAELSKS
jgi:hypothetical protein